MFDTHIHKRIELVPTTVHQHEHRAPTDQSVQLLKEMETAAQKKLISVTRLDDNMLKAEWHRFRTPASPCNWLAIRVKINGSEHTMEMELPWAVETEDAVGDFVYRQVADRLSAILTSTIVAESRKTRVL